MSSPIEQAVVIVGSQAGLARELGVSVPCIHQWLSGERPVPAGRCLAIEKATNGQVSRYVLRPDIYGDPADDPYRESCTP